MSTIRGDLLTQEFKVAVALGLVHGWEGFRKFGMNKAVTAGTEYMWPPGTARVLPSAAAVPVVVSDSVEDDPDKGGAVAGTGTFIIHIDGLDANGYEISDDVTLNGTTNASNSIAFWRINRAYSISSGSGQTNAGNISISIGGNLQAYIEAAEGQTHQNLYTVPVNKYLVVDYYSIRTGRLAGNVDLEILADIMINGTNSWRAISDVYLYTNAEHVNSSSVTVIPPLTEIRQRIVTDGITQCTGIFGGYLVKLGCENP